MTDEQGKAELAAMDRASVVTLRTASVSVSFHGDGQSFAHAMASIN